MSEAAWAVMLMVGTLLVALALLAGAGMIAYVWFVDGLTGKWEGVLTALREWWR